MGAGGHLALPQSEALPQHTPLQEQKWQKLAILAFYIFAPSTPTPTKKNLVQRLEKAISNLVFKAREIIQWCKNTCYLEVGFKACKNIHLIKIQIMG